MTTSTVALDRPGEIRRSTTTRHKTLRGAVSSELKRLNRKTFTGVGAGLITFFALMANLITFYGADQLPGGGPFGGGLVDLTSGDGLVAGLTVAADLIGIVVLSLWAAAVASDYVTGWIRVMVQAEPRRWRLLAGKFAALVGLTAVGTLLATVISIAVAPLLAGATGVSTAAWSSGALATVASTWLNLTLSMLVWGIIGFAIATVTRSAVVAIAGGVGYLLVFEGLLSIVAETATTYLPGSVLSAVVSGGTASLSYGSAMLLTGGYALAAAAVAVYVFHRRDITS